MKKHLTLTALLMSLAIGTSGCLKTRAQLRDESEAHDHSKPIPVEPVQDVQPQGQYALDELKGELTQMQGRIEDLERSQKEMTTASTNKEDLKKLDARIAQLEQTQAGILDSLKRMEETSTRTAAPSASGAPTANPDDIYEKAKAEFESGNYEAAVSGFNQYLKTPKPKHIESATFLRADSYFKMKSYKKAIVDYSKFPEKYTHSKFMPQALYKIGQSFEALGMKEDAKSFYQELVEKFPQSPEAKKAKKKSK